MKLQILNIFFAAGCTLTPIAGSAAENLSAENNNVVKEPYAIFSEYGDRFARKRN